MAANNLLRNASAYLKKSFLICGIKPHLICRMTHFYTAYWSAVNFQPDYFYTTYRSVVNFQSYYFERSIVCIHPTLAGCR